VRSQEISLLLGLVWFVSGLFPLPAGASCPGLTGEALQRCLRGELADTGPRKIVFYAPDGTRHVLESTDVSKSISHVCRSVKQDGTFVAYRSEADRGRDRKWKEVTCEHGRTSGLWKEYFSDDELTTVLFYDDSGTAVKQAIYADGRLLKEQALSPGSR
jgi:hypothetical protein